MAHIWTDRVLRCSAAVTFSGLVVLSFAAAASLQLSEGAGAENLNGGADGSVIDQINQAIGLRKSDLVDLALDAQPGEAFDLALKIDDQPVTMTLWPHSVRAAGFRVRTQVVGGELLDVASAAGRTLRGDIAELPGSRIAGSTTVDGSGLHAMIILANGERLWLEPAAPYVPDQKIEPSLHVLYSSQDIVESPGECGVTDAMLEPLAMQVDAAQRHGKAMDMSRQGGIAGSAIECVEIACDADFHYYQDYGNSVTLVVNQIESIINAVNMQYEEDVQISHNITEIIVRTSSEDNPYSTNNAGGLLNQFAGIWNTQPEWSIDRNVAHLFTGRNLSGSTIGIATLGQLCDKNDAYGLSQNIGGFSNRTDLFAHEVGHNWNAPHCNCPNHTMNPSLTGANQFHPTITIPIIVAFRNSEWCPDLCEEPEPTHPHDTCGQSAVVQEGQTAFDNFLATTTGPDEPGLCGGESTVESDIWFRHTVQCDGELTISLCDSSPGFDTTLAIYGLSCPNQDGTALACSDDACGEHAQVTLPVSAGQVYRIRIGGKDGAHGEGILSIACAPDAPDCPGDLDGSGAVDVFDLLDLLAAWGDCESCSADLNASGSVDVFDLLDLLAAWGDCE